MHNSLDFKLGFGVQQCQNRAGLNGYSMTTISSIQITRESAPALLQMAPQCHFIISFFPANLRASRGTVLLPQEVEGTDCPLTICLSPLSQTSFTTKAFTKLNLQYLDRKKQENDTTQRFLKISSRKLYTVNTNKF